MADREQPYDPYIPSGQNAGRSQGQGQGQDGNHRTAALQAVSCSGIFDTAVEDMQFTTSSTIASARHHE